MCCCCPAAIQALFCLWVQSGFSKGSVAGALTFFPPEPPLYEFERHGQNGEVLGDDDDAENDDDDGGKEEDSERNGTETAPAKEDANASEEYQDEEGELALPTGTAPPLEQTMDRGSDKRKDGNNDKKRKKKKAKSPAAQLTERAKMLRSRSKVRNARDKKDAEADVTYVLRLDPRLPNPPSYGAPIEAIKIPSKDGTYIATVVYKVPEDHVTPETKTIIYSHGNATDVGAMYPLQAMLVQSLLCHVVSYDYSGYGESGGVAMEANTYKDIAAVYDYTLKNVAGGNASNIVLYGQSVGSGPVCHLAQRNTDIGGIILHSPFTSGMRVLTPSRALACLDIYPNINRIRHVKCPVMVIHGVLDEEVDISHGRAMYNAVSPELRRDPWWVPDRGHNDITEGPGKMAEYLRRLRTFITQLDS